MKSYPFKKFDAFTRGHSSGNPAGCIYLESPGDISEKEMQAIAAELQGFVSEMVYLFPQEDGVFLRYYSSECEVDFCGHGTIAVMYDYISSRPDLLDRDVINIRVRHEALPVYNRLGQEGCVYITAPAPRYNPVKPGKADIAAALKIAVQEIDSNLEPALINAGLNTLIVPIKTLTACLGMSPGQQALKIFCLENGIDIVLVFTRQVSCKDSKYRTRVFAPKYGYLEDPATGSGNAAFGYYLMKAGLWNGGPLNLEQNNSYDLPNAVKLNTVQQENAVRVIFGGSAVVKIDGRYNLPASE